MHEMNYDDVPSDVDEFIFLCMNKGVPYLKGHNSLFLQHLHIPEKNALVLLQKHRRKKYYVYKW
jgi:hypothetical protein